MRAFPVILLACLSALPVQGQELTPRAYWPAPVGTTVVSVGAVVTKGDLVPDPSLPISGVDSDIDTLFASMRHTTGLFGRTTNFALQIPWSDGTTRAGLGPGEVIVRDYSGIGDISATVSVNLLGAPAMDAEEYAALRRDPHPILGASLQLMAPTGDYDNDRIVNVSANRWAAKLELGYMYPINQKWLLEFELGTWFFQDNDDFLGKRREQDPIHAMEFHLVHRFRPGFWASLDLNGYRGGRSKLDGTRLDDLQRDSKAGVTFVFPFARGHALKLAYSTGSTTDSDEDFDIYQLSYTRVF